MDEKQKAEVKAVILILAVVCLIIAGSIALMLYLPDHWPMKPPPAPSFITG